MGMLKLDNVITVQLTDALGHILWNPSPEHTKLS